MPERIVDWIESARASAVKEYESWANMKNRCYVVSNPSFANYGGRGVKVCDRWLEAFENFLSDLGPKPSPRHSLDRIDNNGDYEPGNCRWATRSEQQFNRRNARSLNGKSPSTARPRGATAPGTMWLCGGAGVPYAVVSRVDRHHLEMHAGTAPSTVVSTKEFWRRFGPWPVTA